MKYPILAVWLAAGLATSPARAARCPESHLLAADVAVDASVARLYTVIIYELVAVSEHPHAVGALPYWNGTRVETVNRARLDQIAATFLGLSGRELLAEHPIALSFRFDQNLLAAVKAYVHGVTNEL